MRRTQAGTILMLVVLALAPTSALSQENSPSAEKRFSGLVVKHAEILGQVFIVSAKPGEENVPAANAAIQVRIPENDEIIYETWTAEDGSYTIPMLDVGVYRMYVGALRLNLLVEPETLDIGEAPKVIITILPKDIVRDKPRRR